jgi:hypothetical protein
MISHTLHYFSSVILPYILHKPASFNIKTIFVYCVTPWVPHPVVTWTWVANKVTLLLHTFTKYTPKYGSYLNKSALTKFSVRDISYITYERILQNNVRGNAEGSTISNTKYLLNKANFLARWNKQKVHVWLRHLNVPILCSNTEYKWPVKWNKCFWSNSLLYWNKITQPTPQN